MTQSPALDRKRLGLLSKIKTREGLNRLRARLLGSQHEFTKFFFRAVEGNRFREGQHHRLIDRTLDEVVAGRRTRLLVNEPPGYSKTLQCVIMFVARGFALNPRARFLHASYSRELVDLNSQQIIDVMSTVEYKILFGRELRPDASAKSLWRTPEGGMFKASSSGGSVTGFRAGTMDGIAEEDDLEDEEDISAFFAGLEDESLPFSGALIIDDPLKPDDATYKKRRQFVNDRYMNTFRSRLAHERIPIIVSMQRIDRDDFSHHLLTGGGGEKFDHLLLPIEINNAKEYPAAYTHGRLIPHGLPDGPLWPFKHTKERIEVLRKGSAKVFSAHYLQDPRDSANQVFRPEYFKAYEVRPRTLNIAIIVDPSKGRGARSDRTAIAVIGVSQEGTKYLLDGLCHRMNLSQRWKHLARLYRRWVNAPGVMSVTVGYEQYGMQTDLEYIEEQMQLNGPHFHIKEVNWVREGSQSKEDRIERLEPDFKNRRFYVPVCVWRPDHGGQALWDPKTSGIEFRPLYGTSKTTSAQAKAIAQGEAYLVAEMLLRKDEEGGLYDLTVELMTELTDFPNAEHDDLSDSVSRYYDLDMTPAPRKETNEVANLNDELVV